ncbi:unnamed protein product [Dicrocoelium dendriticum]|nr:unnamed protein product [Dicrocoelium dendriticum]
MEDRSFFDLLPQSKRREVEACLDVLNQTAPKINDLENNLLEARSFLNSMLMEKMSNLSSLGCRLRKCVEKARPYYHYKETQLELIEKIRLASDRYHKANERLTASQAAFSRIECEKTTYESMEDSATLETINLCIAQVNAAARELTEVKREHEHLLVLYAQSERLIHHLERWHSLSIKKAEPYFVKKRLFDQQVSVSSLPY